MKSFKTYISILKNIKNRPTKFFFFLVIAIVGLFMQAYMHNYNIVFLVIFFLVGVAGASSIYGVLNLYKIKINLLSSNRFFAQTDTEYKLLITNDREFPSFDINITSKKNLIHLKSIEPHHSQTISLKEKFDTRGLNALSDVRIDSSFPLPHELKYKDFKINKNIVVYAKPKGISLFKLYNKNSTINGEIDDFEGIKTFNQGDSTSYIHWASLAKNDSLMVKNFIYENETQKLHFDFKTLQGTDEERLSQLTLWVLECEKYKLDFTINLNAKLLDSKKMDTDEILKTIAKY